MAKRINNTPESVVETSRERPAVNSQQHTFIKNKELPPSIDGSSSMACALGVLYEALPTKLYTFRN